MKKQYIQPTILCEIRYTMEQPLCESITPNTKATMGAEGEYGNKTWIDENLDGSPHTIKNDRGTLDATTKSRGGDWGSIW